MIGATHACELKDVEFEIGGVQFRFSARVFSDMKSGYDGNDRYVLECGDMDAELEDVQYSEECDTDFHRMPAFMLNANHGHDTYRKHFILEACAVAEAYGDWEEL